MQLTTTDSSTYAIDHVAKVNLPMKKILLHRWLYIALVVLPPAEAHMIAAPVRY
jgi:hypothetical protein